MVILHVKRADVNNTFRFETTTTESVENTIRDLVELHNLRQKILLFAGAIRELAKFGPMRPEGQKGLSFEVANISKEEYHLYGMPTNPDPTNFRYGVPPNASAAATMEKTADDAESAVAAALVDRRQNLSLQTVREHFELLKAAVAIAYPGNHNLPEHDPVREIIDGVVEDARPRDFLKFEDACLWWAGKEMRRDKTLGELIGKNEKTTVIVKLEPRSAGAPAREARIDEETHKAMLSFYHKKEQEHKNLVQDDDDSYLSSAWANPSALKNSLHGGGSIRFR